MPNPSPPPWELDPLPPLPELLRLSREYRGLSVRKLAVASGRVHQTITNIETGNTAKVGAAVLRDLAAALEMPYPILAEAAKRPARGLRPFDVPAEWTRLTPSQRRVVQSVGNAILAAYEQGREDERHGSSEQERQEAEVQATGRALLEQVAELQQPAGRRKRQP